MLVPDHIAKRVARIMYEADCSTRRLLVQRLIDLNERAYFGSIAGIAGTNLYGVRRYARGLSLRINARDTHSYDGIFIFRFDDEIKVGICEAKLLRFQSDLGIQYDLNRVWDWQDPDGKSHFYKQVNDFSKWSSDCAVWFMFMLYLNLGDYSPPLDSEGSSCVWYRDLKKFIYDNKIDSTHLWTLQDVIDIGRPPLINLSDVIYNLLICKQGKKIKINRDASSVSVAYDKGDQIINIPLPSVDRNVNRNEDQRSVTAKIVDFLGKNDLSFYQYYNMSGIKLSKG